MNNISLHPWSGVFRVWFVTNSNHFRLLSPLREVQRQLHPIANSRRFSGHWEHKRKDKVDMKSTKGSDSKTFGEVTPMNPASHRSTAKNISAPTQSRNSNSKHRMRTTAQVHHGEGTLGSETTTGFKHTGNGVNRSAITCPFNANIRVLDQFLLIHAVGRFIAV